MTPDTNAKSIAGLAAGRLDPRSARSMVNLVDVVNLPQAPMTTSVRGTHLKILKRQIPPLTAPLHVGVEEVHQVPKVHHAHPIQTTRPVPGRKISSRPFRRMVPNPRPS